MSWFEEKSFWSKMNSAAPEWWRPCWWLFLAAVMGFWVWQFAVVSTANARGKKEPYVPEIIEVEKPHAWCYVLKNDQSGAVGDIHMISCIPKGAVERNPDLLSIEETERD